VGFHASLDSVFLAAAVPVPESPLPLGEGQGEGAIIASKVPLPQPSPRGRGGKYRILDVGCGVGSVGLCVLSRNNHIQLTGIDIQSNLADIARQNALLNGFADRCRFFHCDIKKEKLIEDNHFNTVMMNPPYLEDGTHTSSPEKIKATSHGEGISGATLEDWIKYAHRKLKQGGFLTLIHRADRMDDVLHTLIKKNWFGSLVIDPLWPHEGEDAKRVIIRARKERYAPTILKSGMIIHKSDGKYTREAEAVLSEGAAISL
jgi:tRNA1(Val) A37 N6-methylase TrmN6